MKKIILAFVFVFLFTNLNIVLADDGGPNTDFWVIDNKTNCVSVVNPEAVGSNAFFVFDYSAKIGQTRGKPWVIIEKGKCYEIDDGSEDIYLVKIVKGDERETFSNYTAYQTIDSISQTFCKNNDCNPSSPDFTPGPIIPMHIFGETSVTTSQLEEIHFTGIVTDALFPTKYDFGFPVTSFSSTMPEELKPIVNYPSFVSASNLYASLAKQLNSILQSCDTRIRVERQYGVDFNLNPVELYVKNVVWRLANNQDIATRSLLSTEITEYGTFSKNLTQPDLLNEINLMGCRTSFGTFTQTHLVDFSMIDRLAQEVIKKYPSALKKSDDDYLSPISLRDSTEISKILAFANSSNVSNQTQTVTTPSTQTSQNIISTVLDEPTPEKKTDMVVNSSNPFMQAYIWLPIGAIIGILAVLAFRKKQ